MKIIVVLLIAITYCTCVDVSSGSSAPDDSIPDIKNKTIATLYREAIKNDDVDFVQRTLDSDGATADRLYSTLRYAAYRGKDRIVELVVKAGADVNKIDGGARNIPLADGIVGGNEKVVEILIENGADVNLAYGDNDNTALHAAVTWQRENIIDMLLKHGAKIDAVDLRQQTPLHYAAKRGSVKIVELLLKNNADRNVLDKDGKTPLNLAEKEFSESGNEDYKRIVDMLKAN